MVSAVAVFTNGWYITWVFICVIGVTITGHTLDRHLRASIFVFIAAIPGALYNRHSFIEFEHIGRVANHKVSVACQEGVLIFFIAKGECDGHRCLVNQVLCGSHP